jgi:hypothetical protein
MIAAAPGRSNDTSMTRAEATRGAATLPSPIVDRSEAFAEASRAGALQVVKPHYVRHTGWPSPADTSTLKAEHSKGLFRGQ